MDSFQTRFLLRSSLGFPLGASFGMLRGFTRLRGIRSLVLIFSLLILGACTEEPSVRMELDKNGGLSASFSPPEILTQSRAIDQSALRLTITVNQVDYMVGIEPGSDTGSRIIPIARGENLDIAVTWSEQYNGILLPLAQATTNRTVPLDAGAEFTINIDTDNYRTNFDFDSDEVSNLDERRANRDPTVVDILEDPIVIVPVTFRANIPERLNSVGDEIDDTLTAFAIFNGAIIELNREGDTWFGEATLPANSDAPVEYAFYSTNRPNAKLATWEGRVNSGASGTTLEIPSNEYGYEIDTDGDGNDNLEEIVLGTNPEDKNDPIPDPCLISNFEAGCTTDTDEDGTPDSVETEGADADGDSIPDYQESINDDADEDGSNAELDRDETDSCVPNIEAITCEEGSPPVVEPPVVEPPVDEPPVDEPPVDDPPLIEPPEPSPLSYNYYEGRFENMPDFNLLTADRSGTEETFLLPSSDNVAFYALQYSGQLFIEEAGEYTFYSESNDGSLIFIDGNVVVDNDGSHDLVETSGTIALPAGLRNIVVEYFQNDGAEALTVSWSSSTMGKQPIPATVLFAPVGR